MESTEESAEDAFRTYQEGIAAAAQIGRQMAEERHANCKYATVHNIEDNPFEAGPLSKAWAEEFVKARREEYRRLKQDKITIGMRIMLEKRQEEMEAEWQRKNLIPWSKEGF
jgi:hypothetical protein